MKLDVHHLIDRVLIWLLVYAQTAAVFVLTIALIVGGAFAAYHGRKALLKRSALSAIPDPAVTRELPLVRHPVEYDPTIQSHAMPDENVMLYPAHWLDGTENCIFATRMNSMKFAGIIPAKWTIADFKKTFSRTDIYGRWRLTTWPDTLTPAILNEVERRLHPASKENYQWMSINNMDELVYLAKRGQHVLVGITVWLRPSKRHPEPRKYLGGNIAHSVTIAGIKCYHPEDDTIEFAVLDPFPYNFTTTTPVYNKRKADGYNIYGRQGVPYICGYAGYVYSDRDGSVAQAPKFTVKTVASRPKKDERSDTQ